MQNNFESEELAANHNHLYIKQGIKLLIKTIRYIFLLIKLRTAWKLKKCGLYGKIAADNNYSMYYYVD